MSAQHHYSQEEIIAQRRMLDEFLGIAKPRFPQGKLTKEDQGEISFAISTDECRQAVVIRFAKQVDWIGLDKSSAIRMAELILEHSKSLNPKSIP